MYRLTILRMFFISDISKKRKIKMSKYWSEMARRAEPYIPGEQINEPNLIKLNTNENPYPPSPQVIRAIEEAVGTELRLYPSPTMDDLRQTIGNYYDLKQEQVFVGNGCDEVLAFSYRSEEHTSELQSSG